MHITTGQSRAASPSPDRTLPDAPQDDQREPGEQAAELQQLNQSLIDNEQRLRLALQTGRIGLWVWNSTDVNNSGDWSPRLKEIFGMPLHAEVTHEMFLDCVHPDDRAWVDDAVMKALSGANGGEYRAEYRTIHPQDGALHWVTARGQAFFGADGRPVRFIGTVMDITERKLAEQSVAESNLDLERRIGERTADLERANRALQRATDDLQQAIDTIPGLVWTSLPDGNIEYLNQRWLEYAGLTQDEATGWGWQRAVHPEDLPGLVEYWKSLLAAGQAGEYEARLRRSDGEYRWFLFRGVPLYDEHGKLVKWYGTNSDIEDRKRAEERLQRSERNLAEGQRLTKTGSWVLDFKTGNTDWSVETCRIFGFPDPPPSPHYSEFRERVHPEDREGVDRGLRESFEAGEPRPLHYRFILPDGTRKHIETISQPVKDAAGTVLRLMGTVMDVTERHLAEDALRGSELLARGQLNALARTLDTLANETALDRLIEHVLRTTTEQLGSHSSSVWLRDDESGLMTWQFALEDGKFRTKDDTTLAAVSPSLRVEDVWPWPEVFRTGQPYLMEDIRNGPDFPWREHVLSLGVASILIVPMVIAGRVEGVIGIRFAQKRLLRPAEMELAQALVNQAMLALQLTRLSARSRETAVTAERNRMARDIHDTLAQGFTGVIVQLEAAEEALSQALAEKAVGFIERAGDLARESLREARRSVAALRPHALEASDLCQALPGLMQKMTAGTTLRTAFHVTGERRPMPCEWEDNLLRIGQEVLTNALRHAQATEFEVSLTFEPQQIRWALRDNGIGFDPQGRHEGFGLHGMRERVESMGGQFFIQSVKGSGTTISIVLPLAAAAESPTP